MKKCRELKEGDKVLIKSWKKMKKEFGTDASGYIMTQYVLHRSMKHLCKTVVNLEPGAGGRVKAKGTQFYISDDMVEAFICDEPEEEFIYPIFKENKVSELITKFTDINKCEVVFTFKDSLIEIGTVLTGAYPHTNDIWKDVAYNAELDLWNGQPVECTDVKSPCVKTLRFFDVENACSFTTYGSRLGVNYENYVPVPTKDYTDWTLEAFSKLQR